MPEVHIAAEPGNGLPTAAAGREGVGCLQRAEEIFRESSDDRGLGSVWQLLGDARLAQGRDQEGIGFYQRAVDRLQGIGDRHGEAQARLRWGRACSGMGLHDQARVLLEQAMSLFGLLGDVRRETEIRGDLAAIASGDTGPGSK